MESNKRIVNVPLHSHCRDKVRFNGLHFKRHVCEKWAAYSQSKYIKFQFAGEIRQRLGSRDIHVYAINFRGNVTGPDRL